MIIYILAGRRASAPVSDNRLSRSCAENSRRPGPPRLPSPPPRLRAPVNKSSCGRARYSVWNFHRAARAGGSRPWKACEIYLPITGRNLNALKPNHQHGVSLHVGWAHLLSSPTGRDEQVRVFWVPIENKVSRWRFVIPAKTGLLKPPGHQFW